jgi:diadenosine tetraphosphate (Ap4A) HIT family hydrolase
MSVFSDKPVSERLYENEHFYILEDGYPVNPGHLLIVSKRVVPDYFSLNEAEQNALPGVIFEARKLIEMRITQRLSGIPAEKNECTDKPSKNSIGYEENLNSDSDFAKVSIENQEKHISDDDIAADRSGIMNSETPFPRLPDGYNIGMNCGPAAGQTIIHFHCHVIPRYHGDTPNPRGGIRHCIPGKGNY